MLNAEKHRDQLLKFVEENHDSLFGIDKNSEPISCAVSRCNNCQFGFKKNNYIEGYSCSAAKMKWLLSEYKEHVKVSKLEYDILTYILKNTECRYITRNKSRSLCVHSYKPVKDTQYGQWTAVCDKVKSCEVFNNLFPFIKWEDSTPTPIKDVLDNCEVVDDAEE